MGTQMDELSENTDIEKGRQGLLPLTSFLLHVSVRYVVVSYR